MTKAQDIAQTLAVEIGVRFQGIINCRNVELDTNKIDSSDLAFYQVIE